MTDFEIYCAECRKKFIISDAQFTELVTTIEENSKKIANILHKHDILVSYKSHYYITEILQQLIRCCANPEIYFNRIKTEDEIDKIIEDCKKRNYNVSKENSEISVGG